jgi:hypothetical protein
VRVLLSAEGHALLPRRTPPGLHNDWQAAKLLIPTYTTYNGQKLVEGQDVRDATLSGTAEPASCCSH